MKLTLSIAKNVTLGIPRLREIVMTASSHIMTPTMQMILNEEITEEHGERFAKGISRLSIAEVLDKVQVKESTASGEGNAKSKIYDIHMELFPAEEYTKEYAIDIRDVLKALQEKFIPKLIKLTSAELKKREDEKNLKGFSAAQPEIGVSVGTIEEAPREAERNGREDFADDDNEDDEDDAKRGRSSNNRSNQISYEGPDDEEDDIRKWLASADVESDGENEGKPRKNHDAEPSDSDSDEEDVSDEETAKKKEVKLREGEIKGKFSEITAFKFDLTKGNSCFIRLEYDVATPKLLLLPLAETAARFAVIQSIPGLGSCTYVKAEKKDPAYILTEGVNLLAARDYQNVIKPHSITTNSIYHMLLFYGVEAARASIVKEMRAVFEGHSISVDKRHLSLIGDVMTHSGGYRAFNRNGLVKDSSSPLAKMSFETTVGFLKEAVLERDWDDLRNPSSRIVVGRTNTIGTGAFDVLAPVA
jgi:DNA-directed RNA polymerase I subunit RPA1